MQGLFLFSRFMGSTHTVKLHMRMVQIDNCNSLSNLLYFMEIKKITTFPIKSLPGISLQEAEITSTGLPLDRCLVLIKAEEPRPQKKWLSVREVPELYNFSCKLDGNNLIIGHTSCIDTVEIDLTLVNQAQREQVSLNIWKDDVIADILDQEINVYFSHLLGFSVQLAGYVSRTVSRERYSMFPAAPTIQDGFPLSVATYASLQVINTWLSEQDQATVDISRFRANIILDGNEAFEEDSANGVLINGKAALTFIEGIPRCPVIEIDPATASTSSVPVLKALNAIHRIGRPDKPKGFKPRFSMGAYPENNAIGTSIPVGHTAVFTK
jgi:uncharacterized protein